MKNFTCVQDIGNLKSALDEAFEIKKDRFKYVELGRNKTLMMIFFNSSLRTRLSTQKAALNLGMNVIVLDINQGAWKLETERGVIMDGPDVLVCRLPFTQVRQGMWKMSGRLMNWEPDGSGTGSRFGKIRS